MGEEPRAVLERLTYEALILKQVERCLGALMVSYRLFYDSVLGLYNMIPEIEREKDELFQKEIAEAYNVVRYLGTGKYNVDTGGRYGYNEIKVKIRDYNAFKLFQACINFLHRRKMLWTEVEKEFWE